MLNSEVILHEEVGLLPMEGAFYSPSRSVPFKPHLVLLVCLLSSLSTAAEVFLGKEIIYQLEEEVPIGTKLADIMTDAGLTKLYKPQEIRKMTLRFNTDLVIPLFIKNGIVRTSGRIDREAIAICQVRDPCEISVDVTVQPYEYFRVIKLIVEILDINDHSPTFQTADDHDSAEISILESVSQGTSIVLPFASDLDSPRYGIAGYQLLMVAGMTAFHLKVTMKVEGVLEAGLVVNEKLDRETTPFYTATLVAYDGGTPTRSTSLNLMIIVLDANDNDPTFEKSYYEAGISESAKFNQTVVYLKAKDIDYGKNAEIRYSLAAQSPHTPIDSFGIDEKSGRLFVKAPLDRETNEKCQLVVSARDLGIHSRQTNVLVTLHVEDINDNSPEISINSLSLVASNAASVPENVPPGTFVAHLTAVDRDLGRNGTVQCYLQNDRTEILTGREKTSRDFITEFFHLEKQKLTFVRGEEEYHLLTAAPLDREQIPKHKVYVACNDEGHPSLTSYATIEIIVIDENDNTPIFKLAEYEVTVAENSIPGSVITRVTATDADAGRNGKVSYKISGLLADYFDIDASGNIILSRHLSREKLKTHKLEVNAVDHGEPRRTGTTFVTINISGDLLLANSTFFFRVTEDQQPGALVGKIISEEDKHVNYEINGLDDFQLDAFVLDQQSGFIKTGKVLDREIQPVYHFWIKQVPSDNKTFQEARDLKKMSITVFMEDVNDNDPLFVFPSPNNFTVVVPSKNFKTEALIARVSAVDRDSGKNAEIEYKLKDCVQSNTLSQDQFHFADLKTKISNKSTNVVWTNSTIFDEKNSTKSEVERNTEDCEIFRIDPNLGNVHVKKRPELNGDLAYHLTIIAVDKGDPERSTLTLLTLIVNSTNAVKRHTNDPISSRTMAVLGFISGTCLVVGILTMLIISIVFFKRYFKRRPDKPSNQINPPDASSVKNSSGSSNSFLAINFSSISSSFRCLTRSCLHRDTRNQSQDDLLRRSVPCIQLNMDQNSSKLLEQTERPTDTTSFCHVKSPQKLTSGLMRNLDEKDSRTVGKNRSITKKYDSMSYFSLDSSEQQHVEARFFQSNWKQKFLHRYPQSVTFESLGGYQSSEAASNNNNINNNNNSNNSNNSMDITPHFHQDNPIQSYSSDRKVVFQEESEEKEPREMREKQIERLTPPPPAQLPPHAVRQLNDTRYHQHNKRSTKDDKNAFMNVERHKIRPFRPTALKQVEESEII